jgi:hypothetical protein
MALSWLGPFSPLAFKKRKRERVAMVENLLAFVPNFVATAPEGVGTAPDCNAAVLETAVAESAVAR